MTMSTHVDLIRRLDNLGEEIASYLETLAIPEAVGEYAPSTSGVTDQGRKLRLGFSSFALRILYSTGVWETLPLSRRSKWIDYLRSFQTSQSSRYGKIATHAFVDDALASYLWRKEPLSAKIRRVAQLDVQDLYLTGVIVAETKQAIATLNAVGIRPLYRYQALNGSAGDTQKYLESLNWRRPWSAGGQAAARAMLLVTEDDSPHSNSQQTQLKKIFRVFFEQLVDANTGGYFREELPENGELINGAMKVLTALDWLEIPIHYPERLIDTCLVSPAMPEGCHILDALYVLYRCSRSTDYRRSDIENYSWRALESIFRHIHPSGGFSYSIGRSQTEYYGVRITEGENVADLHGTYLLSMSLAIVGNLLGLLPCWRIIRP